MENAKKHDYYLGLDVGSNSVGYAVTDMDYSLLKHRGEPMWGVMTFEEGSNAAERRSFRTARRRLDRKKQRVALVQGFFAEEIGAIDPNFFIRRKESALFPEDAICGVQLFQGGDLKDKEYYKRYPTIHHLLLDLMTNPEPHDVRLVYLACSWLVAHRGHFLFDIELQNANRLLDFAEIYDEFCVFLDSAEIPRLWGREVKAKKVLDILRLQIGVNGKKMAFKEQIFSGKSFPKAQEEDAFYSIEQVVTLLAGGKVKLSALFCAPEMEESVCLSEDDEVFAQAIAPLTDEQAEFLSFLRRMSDCARLSATMSFGGDNLHYISAAKVEIYNQHKKDLEFLKHFIQTYHPERFAEIFKEIKENNYVAYSKHIRSVKKANWPKKFKWSTKKDFSDALKKIVKDTAVTEADRPGYEDMMARLEQQTFLPKQRDPDNRIIPQQLYRVELDQILEMAEGYLPMLSRKDADGLTVKEKIQSVFAFRIPYFVGPLNEASPNAWLKRKAEGKILPWNFEDVVDLDASEQRFIDRMTNTCTYLPGEDVVPEKSLLYGRFTVLNELNNLKIDGHAIPVDVKQELFTEVFCKERRVTPKKIKDYLIQHGKIDKSAVLSGLDETVKSSLHAYHMFRRLLESKKLTENQVEDIITHCAYSEDRKRLQRWLKLNYNLSEEDRKYIVRQNLKGFGHLSRKFLIQIQGGLAEGGEQKSILEWLWDTNENLMQLLSGKYNFSQTVAEETRAYYADSANRKELSERLKDYRLPGSVRRSIFRTMDIVQDVVGAVGAPKKIFVEMARGGMPGQKDKRIRSRKQQLLDLYKKIETEDARKMQKQLEAMGEMADNRLQSDVLFLYYLQMGRSMYTELPIEIPHLTDGIFNKDHIYPQSFVKDDSVLNNLVLVESGINGNKSNDYPVAAEIRASRRGFWECLLKAGLMTEEKFRRLTRSSPFTDDEKLGFINRQLVETRQSTKVIAELLQEMYPEAEIVYVKAGLVSEFRQEYDIVKCRSVNDLHHAKDAYLNVVVGNVYHERFNKQWFRLTDQYSVQVKSVFSHPLDRGGLAIWRGQTDIARIKNIVTKNAVHLTRYAFCRTGGLFDQMPVKAEADLVPLKAGLSTEKYGGYNKPTAAFFVLAGYRQKKKRDAMIVPVELRYAKQFCQDEEFTITYLKKQIAKIKNGQDVTDVCVLLGGRKLKINTLFGMDGLRMTLSGKSSGGKAVVMAPVTALILGAETEKYIKRLESIQKKINVNPAIELDEKYDGITAERNLKLFDDLSRKSVSAPFYKLPANPNQLLISSRDKFIALSLGEQVKFLTNLLMYFQRSGNSGTDLSAIGGSKKSGAKTMSSTLSNWKKVYTDVRLIDASPAGLSETAGENLMGLL